MRKNIIKIAAITLLSAFALTACDDDIIAKPSGYDKNSPVVDINGDSDIYNNNLVDIYDSIRSGSLATDVLDQLLYQYSVSVFGNYNKVTAKRISNNKFGDVTLKDAVKGLTHDASGDLTGGNDVAKAFINSHKAYWTTDKKGERLSSDVTLAEFARLEEKWNTIEKRIAQKMYSFISGGSYSEENVFEEAKFLRSLAGSIENNIIALNGSEKTFKGVLTAQVEDYDVFNEKSKNYKDEEDFILHRENYQSNYALDAEEVETQDATYVEDKLIPDIYRQLLVEQYILDKSYDTLGRTSARHISVLSISKNSKAEKAAADLMNAYVKNYIFDKTGTKTIDLKSFKMVSNAWIGAFMSDVANCANTDEYALMSIANQQLVNTDPTKPYYKGTAYGDMMEEISKINDNPVLSENESTYTGSNSYTVEVGKEIKTRELELKDYTSTGWYIKSVGVSSLPEDIKSKLFDINVANALNPTLDKDGNVKNPCVEYTVENGAWTTNVDKLEAEGKSTSHVISGVGKINGNYFLRKTSRIASDSIENDVLFENDGTYYVVLIEDAIRSKNLDKSQIADLDADGLATLETYINEIVQIVANNDTYKNLSKKHWLEEMNIKYHDTTVYEYFKSNFPELFD